MLLAALRRRRGRCCTGRRPAANSRKASALPDRRRDAAAAGRSEPPSDRDTSAASPWPNRDWPADRKRSVRRWREACSPAASSSAGARHRQTLPRDGSCEADASNRPSGENRKASTVPLCLSVIRSSPVGTSQITTLLSALPEAKVLPSGEKAKVQTNAWCFFKTNGFIVPVGASSGQRSISPVRAANGQACGRRARRPRYGPPCCRWASRGRSAGR